MPNRQIIDQEKTDGGGRLGDSPLTRRGRDHYPRMPKFCQCLTDGAGRVLRSRPPLRHHRPVRHRVRRLDRMGGYRDNPCETPVPAAATIRASTLHGSVPLHATDGHLRRRRRIDRDAKVAMLTTDPQSLGPGRTVPDAEQVKTCQQPRQDPTVLTESTQHRAARPRRPTGPICSKTPPPHVPSPRALPTCPPHVPSPTDAPSHPTDDLRIALAGPRPPRSPPTDREL
jgi:hypothetical protein